MRLYGLEEGPLTLTLGAHAMLTDGFEQAYGLLTDKPYSWQARAHVSHTIRHMLSSVGLSAGRSKEDRKRERYLEQAVRYMTDRLADSLTLADLARATGLSKQHLIYLFNRETGRPPVEYYLRLKMQRAGQLLDLTDLSVKEIAGAVGISDPYYFSRLFKRMMGCSPTEYRNIPKG
jgi:transcriptional regulator GlxA family with amidase domain